MDCPHCRAERIGAWSRIFSSAEYPVTCGSCNGRSLPRALPASEFRRVALASPLLLLTLAGARFLPFRIWIWSLILLLLLTLTGIAWMQLHLKLVPALPTQIQSARWYNLMAGAAIATVGILTWYV